MKPHVFAPDDDPADHNGQHGCRHCPLPERNKVHIEAPTDAFSDRINGEHDDKENPQ